MQILDLLGYFLMFFAGVFSGFIDAIVGGGGLITLPALLAFGLAPHAALATNKLLAVFGSFTAMVRFTQKGYIDFSQIWLGCLCAFAGSLLGAFAVLHVDASVLAYLVPILLIVIFFYTLFSPRLGADEGRKRLNERLFLLIFGSVIGFYDGFFGPATGSFWIFAFVLLQGLTLKNASAQTKALNFSSNLGSLVLFLASQNAVVWLGILMGLGQMVGAVFGANVVMKCDVKFVRVVFLCVVGAMIFKLVAGWF